MQHNRRLHVLTRHLTALSHNNIMTSCLRPFSTSSSLITDPHVNFHVHSNGLAEIELNRPKALHALTLSMVKAVLNNLQVWLKDHHIKAIIVHSSTPERSTCAGGDIKSLANPEYAKFASEFFATEYQMNYLMYKYRQYKPIISLQSGLVMGGGIGITAHNSYRIVTDTTVWAMPETSIGLIPDVGATYILSHLKPSLSTGIYIGLTGKRLNAADCLYTGLATHYTQTNKLTDLLNLFKTTQFKDTDNSNTKHSSSFETVEQILSNFCSKTDQKSEISSQQKLIDKAFNYSTFEQVKQQLESMKHSNDTNETQWSNSILNELLSKSAISCQLTNYLIYSAKNRDLKQSLQYEYRVASRLADPRATTDLFEGVRVVLVEKNKVKANWKPSLTSNEIEQFCQPLTQSEDFHQFNLD